MSFPKIGTLDIETAPIDSHTWGLFDQNVGLNMINNEWTILSYCYKPLDGGPRSVIYRDTSNEADPRADGELLFELLQPVERLKELQDTYRFSEKMIVTEQFKTMPFGAVWDEYCRREGVPTDGGLWAPIKAYEDEVLSGRA